MTRQGDLRLGQDSTLTYQGEGAAEVAELLADYLRPATGFALPVQAGRDGSTIHLEATGVPEPDAAGFVCENYSISVNGGGAILNAENATGLARAVQTFRQLLPPAIFSDTVQEVEWTVPVVEIEDAPRFRWRGQHLDVARHFFSVEEVCRFIDLLALHRLNVCHLHLTDDQGWRIEIKRYPRLTEIGSKRDCTLIGDDLDRPRRYDNAPYGGFYTQEDIRAIVAYAKRRHIMLVPEIDMPGHMQAAISAYPELGNIKERNLRVRCHWGISKHVLNVEPETVDFMKNVLDEVMELFPGRFIHIGGDEAPKTEWNESERVQERMMELGLRTGEELQSWFIRQMDAHLRAAGRRLVGWDEILEGGLADDATVMSWRSEQGAVTAAELGRDAVATPNQRVYFDYYQVLPESDETLHFEGAVTSLESVYAYEPIPEAMHGKYRHHVLGSQGHLWTEYMPTMEQVEQMGFPRICALAEVLWLQAEKKDYADFLMRLDAHRERLAVLQVNAHPEQLLEPDLDRRTHSAATMLGMNGTNLTACMQAGTLTPTRRFDRYGESERP